MFHNFIYTNVTKTASNGLILTHFENFKFIYILTFSLVQKLVIKLFNFIYTTKTILTPILAIVFHNFIYTREIKTASNGGFLTRFEIKRVTQVYIRNLRSFPF